MGPGLYWIYAFNVVINSTLSFFTTLVFVQLLVHVLRITHPRVKVFCYLLPFCKIVIDFFLYHFSNWALMHQTNPILAETGTRQLSIGIHPFAAIGFSMKEGTTFSIADVIALSVHSIWIYAIVLIAVLGAIFAMTKYLVRLVQDKKYVDRILQSAVLVPELTLNHSLTSWMQRKHISCATTSEVDSPCIVGKTILFPPELIQELSQEEREAIVAHEISHYYWRDCGLRLVYVLLAAFFWWIPTRRWIKHVEETQELASDFMIHSFGISKFALAESVLKAARRTIKTPSKLIFSFVEQRQFLRCRMQIILQEPKPTTLGWNVIQYGLLGVSLLSLLFGKMWVF